jgi:hypothetical protein
VLSFGFLTIVGLQGRVGQLILGATLGLLSAASCVYAVVRFEEGRVHQGLAHTVAANAVSLAALAYLGWRFRRLEPQTEWREISTFAMFLSMWLFWLAFPYFGEGI